MKSPVEMIKEEFCSRYGLDPEQVSFEVKLYDIPKVEAEVIAKDYGNKYKDIPNYFMGKNCVSVDTENFNMWIHYPKHEQEPQKEDDLFE